MGERGYRAARWVASRRTIQLAGELGPERLLLNFACALIGLGALLDPPRPGSVLALWPRWFAIEWAVAMLIGGIAALYGIIRGAFPATEKQRQIARLVEWVGYVCLAAAGLVFGLTSLIVFGWASLRASVLFLVIAACKLIRLLLAYVAREEVLRRFDEGGRR